MWRPTLTKSTAIAAVLLIAVSGSAAVAASPADSAKKAKQADLVVKDVAGSVSGRTATVSATVTNKPGKKKGKKSKAAAVAFVLSADATADAGDTALGQSPLAKLKPKKSATVTGTFSVAATVPAGSYYLVACADPGSVVKEKKEQNNCSASAAKLTVVATPPAAPITVQFRLFSPIAGTITATASNGTCTTPEPFVGSGTCTVTPGVGTVTIVTTFNIPANVSYAQDGNGPCDGTVSGATGATMTFTAPSGNKSCVANAAAPG
jgi:hypothetical protein